MLNLGPKTSIWGKFRGKIEILSKGQKFAAVCRKIATSCHDAAAHIHMSCHLAKLSVLATGKILCYNARVTACTSNEMN